MQDLVSRNSQIAFGRVKLLSGRIAEVVINKDLVMDLEKIKDYEEAISQILPGKYGLLINEEHAHIYTEEAQEYLAKSGRVKATAMVLRSRFSDVASAYLNAVHEHSGWNLKVFYDRSKAITWLREKLGEEDAEEQGSIAD